MVKKIIAVSFVAGLACGVANGFRILKDRKESRDRMEQFIYYMEKLEKQNSICATAFMPVFKEGEHLFDSERYAKDPENYVRFLNIVMR